jgi:tetratricopeptide (TPR) repeat protein
MLEEIIKKNIFKFFIFFSLFLLFLILLSFLSYKVYAQAYIFVSSDPFKADIYFDGELIGQTPYLITNVSIGIHKIVLKKNNFQTHVEDINIDKEGVFRIRPNLIPINFSFFVPNVFYIIDKNNEKIIAPFYVNDISSGFYKIVLEDQKVEIKKFNFFSYSKWITLCYSLISLSSGFLLDKIIKIDENFTKDYFNITKGLLVGSGTLSLIFSTLFFIFDLKTKKNGTIEIIPYQYKESESDIYSKAMYYLNSSKYDEAIYYLTQFYESYPDSKFISDVIYYLGYIYEIKEDYEKALKFYLLLINNYPVYEWYDLTVFSIAKIYYKQKRYLKSMETLRNILFIDEDLVPKELVYLYFFRNCYYLRKENNLFKQSITLYFNIFKEYYQTSKFIYEIYYLYSLFLIEEGNIKEAKELLKYLSSTDNIYKNEAKNLLEKYN